ncbi:uncharacterized protein LOC112576040 [Pomacea canaliculata]|nr:uncharacterized protein LOC112576040 [Pomacea canaliculata]XP_025114048.1 uncharacterized protein LOC112576040 [Pomacea canaliculata]
MTMALLWIFAVLSILVCSAMPPFGNSFFPGLINGRCSLSEPCRIKIHLHRTSTTTETAEQCRCPPSNPCSSDWEGDASRVITVKHLNDMTMSMMFCSEVQPRILCTDNGTALQLAEVSILPQNVEFFTCTCADSRPLVLDETYIDYDHATHMKYSCPEFKRQCNIQGPNRDECMSTNEDETRTQYPCECPTDTSCDPDRSVRDQTKFFCRDVRQ